MPILELVYPLKLLILKGLHIVQGYKITYLNKEYPISTNAIYAFNHSCYLDIPIASEVIRRHCYILMGVQNLRIADKLFFAMNGAIWVDRHNAKSRNDAAGKMCDLLEAGKIMAIPFCLGALCNFSSGRGCFQRNFFRIWRTCCFPA